MLHNFTAADIIGSVEASLLLILILFIPGYVIGWLSNVFDFRERRFKTQVLLSTPVAVAVVPILIFLVGRYPKVLWTLLGASWLGFVFLFLQIWKRWSRIGVRRVPRVVWIGGALAFAWAFIAIATLVDLQFKDRLYFSTTAFDYSTRTAFTAAAARTIAPINPFFAGNPPISLRYHYFWMLVCSLVTHLGNVNSRQAMYGGTVWAGIALMSMIVISLKFFLGAREHLARKASIGCSLLLVTGLDILPTAFLYIHSYTVTPDMEWWNEQITSWVDALLWTPHHIMGMATCMLALLVIRQPATTVYQRTAAILIAGLAFASAVGLSVLATFTFALFALFWLPLAAYRKWWDDVTGLLGAGAVGLIVALPYLKIVMGPGVNSSGGDGRFFAVAIRKFPLAMDLIGSMFHTAPQKLLVPDLILLLLLPLNYLLELGFFFAVGALRIHSIRTGSAQLTREEQTGWMIVGTSFLVGSFMRSTTIDSNDLGWRCFLQAQFVLLLWAVLLVDDWWSSRRFSIGGRHALAGFVGTLAALGLIGTVYQVSMLRIYPILQDNGMISPKMAPWLDQDRQLGERTYALRSVYESLGTMLPADAIVQYDPDATSFIPQQLYSGHGAAMGLPQCGVVFGGDVSQCEGRMKSIVPLFRRPSQAESAGLDFTCREYGINVMVVDDLNPVWRQRDSWVWTRKPILANDYVRAFACGDPRQQARLEYVQ
jgi:hypothetical protein